VTFREVAKAVALFSVFAVGILAILGSNPSSSPPPTPSAPKVEIPGAPAGAWEEAPARPDGTFSVLPLGPTIASSPLLRVNFSPANASVHITAQLPSTSAPVEIPSVAQLSSATVGYTSVPTPVADRSLVEIKLPQNFQLASPITINISDVSVGAESAPLTLKLVNRLYDVLVAVSDNGSGKGHIESNPSGLNCGAMGTGTICVFTFPSPGLGPAPSSSPWPNPQQVVLIADSAGALVVNGWSGDCSLIGILQSQPSTQSTCTVDTDGVKQLMATAIFGGAAIPPAPICPSITYQCYNGSGNMPQCKDAVGASYGANCDSMGFYTCPSGAPRCTTFNDLLIQPGGCYQRDPSPPCSSP